MTQTDGKIQCVVGLEVSVLFNWPYYPRQSTDSMQYPLKAFLIKLEHIILKFFMEIPKISNSQNNLEKEGWSWRKHASCLQPTLQSYSHQNSIVLAENGTLDQWDRIESAEINSKPVVTLAMTRGARIYNGKRRSQQVVLGKLDSYT